MEVKFADKNKVLFDTLKNGDIFLYGGRYYMKTFDNCGTNTIDLNGDCAMTLRKDTLVIPVVGCFVVEG